MSHPKALQARQLSARHGRHQVLHAVNVDFEAGRWTCIVGPNGAGKTSLLKVLAGLMDSDGEVLLLDKPLGTYSPRVRAQQLAWLGQHDNAGDDLSVYDVVMLGRLPHRQWWNGAGAQDRAVVEQCLDDLQLSEWRNRSLGSLSGGERQRVLLARALAVQAQVLLMDEPVANADVPHQADWLNTVQAATRQGQTVVSVLHDLNLAMRADRLVVMQRGRVVMQAAVDDPALHACLQDVFVHRLVFHQVQGQWIALPR
ncbi:MAG: ABC transporter ATP-binding protein [Limnohabitans sp.]|nr:ABC transporter ATP-binding protein [Limnohabitans sp.]